jgi:DHA1 family purine ribonucleoside efflux pump-like MFS transporter
MARLASLEVNMLQTRLSDRSWSATTWLSVISLAFGSFALVSSELLPMGLLTPLARDIGVTEGVAGQVVTLTAIFAGLAAPTVALIIGRLDRKPITLALCALVIISNIAAALAWNYWVLLGARVVLGAALGGFFALVGATIVRLVSMQGFGKGMAVVFMGISAATIAGPPLGALIAEAFGWRTAFLAAAGSGLVALLLQAFSLPSVPATSATSLLALFGLLTRTNVRVGLVAGLLVVGGHFAGFTFIRPYLESTADFDATAIAAVLLAYGVASLIGNAVAGVSADRVLQVGFSLTGLLLGAAALGLATLGTSFVPALAFATLWGFAFGAAPVMIQTWMGRAAPDQLEGVGGLFLAVLQFAIALGAIAGGIAVDLYGVSVPLSMTALCGVLAAALVATRQSPDHSDVAEVSAERSGRAVENAA